MTIKQIAVLWTLLTISTPAWSVEAYQSYLNGKSSLKKGHCASAVASFEAAIEKDGKETRRKRTYGVNFIEYFPHLELNRHAVWIDGTPEVVLRESGSQDLIWSTP